MAISCETDFYIIIVFQYPILPKSFKNIKEIKEYVF
ncbi:hypothetical protein QFZ37_001079 [Chryseobacterium ginsenosidimutans]|nr:hypothetical protein [Chryseobacterium ginsenosidimutans]